MTYAGTALQGAIYAHLQGMAGLAGVPVVDATPGVVAETMVVIGQEEVLYRGDQGGRLAEHRIVLSILSEAEGFARAKEVAGIVTEGLVDADVPLAIGGLVELVPLRVVAKRLDDGSIRRIDITLRVLIDL